MLRHLLKSFLSQKAILVDSTGRLISMTSKKDNQRCKLSSEQTTYLRNKLLPSRTDLQIHLIQSAICHFLKVTFLLLCFFLHQKSFRLLFPYAMLRHLLKSFLSQKAILVDSTGRLIS